MPSTYAHYRLGQEVLDNLSGGIKSTILNHKQLYDIGLHGPDILFYYKPLFSCEVNKQGYDMHARSGRQFFENAAEVLKRLKSTEKEAALAYVYGFCCHFALDVSCHRYIDEKIEADGVSHTEIEVEFDRSLMEKDGYNPVTHILTDHIIPSYENADIICRFYDSLSPEQVKKAMESMISYNRLLIAPSRLKRMFIYGLLGITGNYKEMHGLIVNYKANPLCEDSTQKLYTLYARLGSTFKNIRKEKHVFMFLLAFFFYIDGVYTIIDMATAYGSALGLDSTGLLLALLVTQIVAFPCAILFGHLSYKVSTEKLITVCICAYLGIAIFAIFLRTQFQFWILAILVGMFQGGIQALSRSYFTKIIPEERSGEYFGLMDICGKGASFVGTTIVSVISQITGNINIGVGMIAILFCIGTVIFFKSVSMAKKQKSAVKENVKSEGLAGMEVTAV